MVDTVIRIYQIMGTSIDTVHLALHRLYLLLALLTGLLPRIYRVLVAALPSPQFLSASLLQNRLERLVILQTC